MGKRTGRPRGRPKGARNRRTIARQQAMAEAVAKLGDFAGDAHALLMSIYKDSNVPLDLRADAAKACLRFEKPALSAVAAQVKDGHNPYEEILALVSDKSRGLPADVSSRARKETGKEKE
jgi:hypothetical protein